MPNRRRVCIPMPSQRREAAERQERKTRSTATEANDQGSRHGLEIASALTSGGRAAEAKLRERANTAGSGRAGTLRLEAEKHLDYVRAPRVHQDALLDLGEILGVLCFHLERHTRAALKPLASMLAAKRVCESSA